MVFSRNLKYAAETMPEIVGVSTNDATSTAVNLLMSGHVIALPTDTIYGIAVSAQDNNGIEQLYKIKKRDLKKPIAICVGQISDVNLWAHTSHLKQGLLEALLPGAVTIVLNRKETLNPLLNPDSSLVGIRLPDYPFIQKIAKLCNAPLALTSANLSTETSPLRIEEFSHLWPSLAAVFDGGVLGNSCLSRQGSTVVDFSKPGYFKILRSGSALETTLYVTRKYGVTQLN